MDTVPLGNDTSEDQRSSGGSHDPNINIQSSTAENNYYCNHKCHRNDDNAIIPKSKPRIPMEFKKLPPQVWMKLCLEFKRFYAYIRNLPLTVQPYVIKLNLASLGFNAERVLPLKKEQVFYVKLELKEDVWDVFKVTKIAKYDVIIEEPFKRKHCNEGLYRTIDLLKSYSDKRSIKDCCVKCTIYTNSFVSNMTITTSREVNKAADSGNSDASYNVASDADTATNGERASTSSHSTGSKKINYIDVYIQNIDASIPIKTIKNKLTALGFRVIHVNASRSHKNTVSVRLKDNKDIFNLKKLFKCDVSVVLKPSQTSSIKQFPVFFRNRNPSASKNKIREDFKTLGFNIVQIAKIRHFNDILRITIEKRNNAKDILKVKKLCGCNMVFKDFDKIKATFDYGKSQRCCLSILPKKCGDDFGVDSTTSTYDFGVDSTTSTDDFGVESTLLTQTTSSTVIAVTDENFNTASSTVTAVTDEDVNTASSTVTAVTDEDVNTASSTVIAVTDEDFNTASSTVTAVTDEDVNTASSTVNAVADGDLNTASSTITAVACGDLNMGSSNVTECFNIGSSTVTAYADEGFNTASNTVTSAASKGLNSANIAAVVDRYFNTGGFYASPFSYRGCNNANMDQYDGFNTPSDAASDSSCGSTTVSSSNLPSENDHLMNNKDHPSSSGESMDNIDSPVSATGLWYRDRNREKQKKDGLTPEQRAEMRMRKRTCIPIELPPQKIKSIREFLNNIGAEAPPTISQIRKNNEGSANVHDKYRHLEETEFKKRFLKSISGSIETNIRNSVQSSLFAYRRESSLDEQYAIELKQKTRDSLYIKMSDMRKKLPADSKESEIIEALENHQVILISGETGCGKTTQVPQFILDHEIRNNRGSGCHILCTQPRRISAISVAERIADERAEAVGYSVGYQIRLEHKRPRKTGSILFCTTGILLQMMQNDPVLKQVSHVILDEIHERDTLSDFSITILRDLIKMRKDLKVILMSATLNASQFSKYYDNCPTVNIPGFTYAVKEYYLEDVMLKTGVIHDPNFKRKYTGNYKKKGQKSKGYVENFLEPYVRNMRAQNKYSKEILDYLLSPEAEELNLELILHLLIHICKKEPPGAVLVFLPGWDKISVLVTKMNESLAFPESQYLVIPLHSMMPTATQKSIFCRPPSGVRKIVIATNIAETSITIDDIVYVIDGGKIKMKSFEVENNATTLKEEWVSLANARQRRGRAGRVQEGVCYHMYCRTKELDLESYQLPEMLRTRLEEVILQLKILQLGDAESFLKKVMDPPLERTISLSLKLLKDMNALDADEHLTPLGYHLGNLPVDPQAGKMVLFAALFGCVDPITSIASSLSFKDAFFCPLGREPEVRKVKQELSEGSKSDHILMANVMNAWRTAMSYGKGRSFAADNFLTFNTLVLLRDMKKQFMEHLYEMNFVGDKDVESPTSNYNSENHALIRSVICAGLYPNIAIVKAKKKGIGHRIFTAEDGTVGIHMKSVNYQTTEIEGGFLAYYLKIKSKSVSMHDTSMIFPMSLIFFCQSFTVEDYEHSKKLIKLNNNMCFICDPEISEIIQELRSWLDWLLEYKIAHPGIINWSGESDEALILKAIIVLLSAESRLYLQEYSDYSDEDNEPEYYHENNY